MVVLDEFGLLDDGRVVRCGRHSGHAPVAVVVAVFALPLHDVLFCREGFEGGGVPDRAVVDEVLVAGYCVTHLHLVLQVLFRQDVSDVRLVIDLVPKLILVDNL